MIIDLAELERAFSADDMSNRGVQCICGQHWPDFGRTELATQFRTECCGSVYQYSTGMGAHMTLSLVMNNTKTKEAEALLQSAFRTPHSALPR